jgi:hypothetical protein
MVGNIFHSYGIFLDRVTAPRPCSFQYVFAGCDVPIAVLVGVFLMTAIFADLLYLSLAVTRY